mmetsp:Transcript_131363/g.366242  ORF Transcript_131363/g.366242 Transcript_131363/m.366242 type:complete len:217 (+) Transcript_131363:319-969(+)
MCKSPLTVPSSRSAPPLSHFALKVHVPKSSVDSNSSPPARYSILTCAPEARTFFTLIESPSCWMVIVAEPMPKFMFLAAMRKIQPLPYSDRNASMSPSMESSNQVPLKSCLSACFGAPASSVAFGMAGASSSSAAAAAAAMSSGFGAELSGFGARSPTPPQQQDLPSFLSAESRGWPRGAWNFCSLSSGHSGNPALASWACLGSYSCSFSCLPPQQ